MSFHFNSPTTSTANFATSSSSSSNSTSRPAAQPFAPSPLKAGFTVDSDDFPVYFGLPNASDASADLPKAGDHHSIEQILALLASPVFQGVDPVGIPDQLLSFDQAQLGQQYSLALQDVCPVGFSPTGYAASVSPGSVVTVPDGINDLAVHCDLPMALPTPPLTRPAIDALMGVEPELDELLNEYIDQDCLTQRSSSDSRPSPTAEYLTTPAQSPVEHVAMALFEDIPNFLSATLPNSVVGASIPRVSSTEMMPPPPVPLSKGNIRYTGTRKGLSSASLIPLDAPIQSRTYIAPSPTSRKEVPQSIKRKRVDEDDLHEHISKKRLQNTQAARRSRRRKVQHLETLETALSVSQAKVNVSNTEVNQWRSWAMRNGFMEQVVQFSAPTLSAMEQLNNIETSPSP